MSSKKRLNPNGIKLHKENQIWIKSIIMIYMGIYIEPNQRASSKRQFVFPNRNNIISSDCEKTQIKIKFRIKTKFYTGIHPLEKTKKTHREPQEKDEPNPLFLTRKAPRRTIHHFSTTSIPPCDKEEPQTSLGWESFCILFGSGRPREKGQSGRSDAKSEDLIGFWPPHRSDWKVRYNS